MTTSEPAAPKAYRLKFIPAALQEWEALDGSVKSQFKKQLEKRLSNPKLASAQLRGALSHCYKIKLLKMGYRLIYTVIDDEILVLVLAVGKREGSAAYLSAQNRV